MLSIFFTTVLKYWGNLQAVLETLKTSARGYWAGLNKRRLKVLYFTSANILSTLPPSIWYGSYHKIFGSTEPK